MSVGPGKLRRWPAALGLAVIVFLLGGCVYLRLLAFKHQLGDFDRSFTLEAAEGLRIRCHKPVLLTSDLRWLGMAPEITRQQERSEQWRVHWVKQHLAAGAGRESAAHDIELELKFTDKKLSEFFIGERYFAFIPKPFFVSLLRCLGVAAVDRGKRTISANIPIPRSQSDQAGVRPTIAALTALFGEPTERRTENSSVLLRYHYVAVAPGAKDGDFDLLFTFDTASGDLLHLQGQASVGTMLFNFTEG